MLKMREKYYKTRKLIFFNTVQREDAYMIQPQLKVEKEDAWTSSCSRNVHCVRHIRRNIKNNQFPN